MTLQPKLATFKVEAFRSANRHEGASETWDLHLTQFVEIALALPVVKGSPIQALVKVRLDAHATATTDADANAAFHGEYLGKFNYAPDLSEADIAPQIANDDHQYLLAAQVYPLAMSHFRRQLQATGFDARGLALGL